MIRFVLVAGAVLLASGAEAAPPARVSAFVPQGVAKAVQQARATFSAPMVAFGDPTGGAAPFRVECPVAGSGRWVDQRSWVYDFAQPLPGGVRCRFELEAGRKTLAGGAIGGTRAFAFSTGGPAVLESTPWEGSPIDDDQAFLLRLDADATEDSVLRHAAFSAAGVRDPVGVRILTGPEREEILGTLSPEERKEKWLVLQARQRFPADAAVVLQWGAGIATPGGVATTEPQRFQWKVRPPFHVRVQCNRERAKADCVPITPIRLVFSAPVPWSAAGRIALVQEGGTARFAAARAYDDDDDPLVDRIQFRGPFAPNASFRIEIPDDLRDDAGRSLAKPAPADRVAKTAGYPPLAKFPARFGIVELRAGPALPVTVRAIEPELRPLVLGPAAGATLPTRAVRVAEPPGAEILATLRRLDATTDTEPLLPKDAPGAKRLALPLATPPPGGDSEVIGIPLEGPGLHLVEIESRILGQKLLDPPKPMFVSAGALVTDLSVHLAWGRDVSLVWVTSLERAQPVAGARVAVYDCRATIRFEGTTDASGVARIEGLPAEGSLERCENPHGRWSDYDDGLLVTASRDGDLGFVHSSWTNGIEPWRFQLPTAWYESTPVLAHTIFARTLLRAGETVQMKHVLRRPDMQGFSLPAADALPTEVVIRHAGSGQEYVLPVSFAPDGTALSDWRVPPGGKLGGYAVTLRGKDAAGASQPELESGSFRVEEFRLPFLRGTIRTPKEAQVGVAAVPVDVAVQFLSGGGASKLPVVLRSELRTREELPFSDAPGLSGFAFARGAVTPGVVREGCEGEDCAGGEEAARRIATQPLVLDAVGTAKAEIPVSADARPRELAVELEYRDPSGAAQTSAASVPLWPAARVVGLRVDAGVGGRQGVRASGIVLDLDGNPVAGAPVTVEAFARRVYTHRRRLVGGFYAYASAEETRPLRRLCETKSDSLGRISCQGEVAVSGNVLLEARTQDAAGRTAVTWDETWLAGADAQWFEPTDGDRMDVLPEKRRYEPGETARFQVRLPFPEATALVAVERSGVGSHSIVALSAKNPVVEVPITAAHAPNVFVSVLAVRGRAADAKPTAMVDLGRPAYRLGIAEIEVGWKENRLAVEVSPEREVYRVREKARISIEVGTESGAKLPPGAEVAIAAVDEALLELLPNRSWELLPAMMGRRSFGVSTATAQGLVIGKRHFGLKALPHGGGGGRQSTRELFDTLLLWQGRVALDARGRATIEVPLNDSLSSFRVAAVATAGTDRFGTGSATIRTTQDLMVLPGLPPVVREGDRFPARFTLRNTTRSDLDVALSAQVAGLASAPAPVKAEVEGGEARELSFDVVVPAGASTLAWDVAVTADGRESDRLRIVQRVVPAVPVRTFQGTVASVDPELRVPLRAPEGALPGRGGVDVAVRAKLADGLDGVSDFLRQYPFGCLEQRASRAVGMHDAAAWQTVVEDLPSYLDDDGLARFFPSMREGSVVLTTYLLQIADEAKLEIPAGPRDRMLDGLARFAKGELRRDSVVPAPDATLRRVGALDALSRHGRTDPKLLTTVEARPDLWPMSTLLDWIGVLRRTKGVPNGATRLAAARRLLDARLVLQGTTLSFTTQASDDLPWLLSTPDVNAGRVILEGLERKQSAQEMARLVRGSLARQVNARWDTTLADAWGVVALDRFSAAFESTPVTGAVEVALAGVTRRLAPEKREEALFAWPPGPGQLTLRHDGTGRPWATVRSLAAVPLTKPVSAGFTLVKSISPVLQKTPGAYSRGDVVKVTLDASAQTDSAWVVVRDPIPSGATLLGSGLGGGSLVADAAAGPARCPCPAYTERSFEAFTQFYEWVPQGAFRLEYVMVLNQDGTFLLPPARVEAMYAPETFAETPNPPVTVVP